MMGTAWCVTLDTEVGVCCFKQLRLQPCTSKYCTKESIQYVRDQSLLQHYPAETGSLQGGHSLI